MNAFEYLRGLKKIDIANLAVYSVHVNAPKSNDIIQKENTVFSDLFRANNRGLTFSGGKIRGVGEFNDWIESGEFRENLQFIDGSDIELVSWGDGSDAIEASYAEENWIAPTAKVLSEKTIENIRKSFIKILNEQIKSEAK